MIRGGSHGYQAQVNTNNNLSITQKTVDILRALFHLNDNQRVTILRTGSRELIKFICECSLNILRGNLKLSDCEKSRLRKYAGVLRKFALSPGKFRTKRRLIVQYGCGSLFSALLVPIINSDILSSRNSRKSTDKNARKENGPRSTG